MSYLLESEYCGNAELRANHTDICKGIHNDDSARALQAFGWISVTLPVIAGVTTAFALTSVLANRCVVHRPPCICS